MTAFNLQETIALLERTPAAVDALLRGLPDSWTRHNEGEETWSVYDVVGHLVYAEHVDWIPRAQMILQHGEAKEFEPFDRIAQFRESRGKTLANLLEAFATLRAENIEALRAWNLTPVAFDRRGRHPSLGPVTLSQLLATWAVHDMTHLHQISRIIAHQYRDAVGPWSAYLGVLLCEGHSS